MTDIQVIQNNNTAIAVTEDFKAIATQWLTSTGNLTKFTESEKAQFIDMCVAFGLNPIKREVYGIKYGSTFNLIVGYETYLKRAEQSGYLDGFETTFIENDKGITSATCTVYRKDRKYPTKQTVYFSEYNANTAIWKSKPHTMLEKVAIAQAFRKAFPCELGGMPYLKEELDQSIPVETIKNVTPAEPIKETTKLPKHEETLRRLAEKKPEEMTDEELTAKIKEYFTYRDPLNALVFNEYSQNMYRQMYKDKGLLYTFKKMHEYWHEKSRSFGE